MRNKVKAFTLIEVLVVLSLLALIAILAYNVFGRTMKDAQLEQAHIKLLKDIDGMSKAFGLYMIDDGTTYYTTHFFGSGTPIDGYFREIPSADLNPYWDGASDYNYADFANRNDSSIRDWTGDGYWDFYGALNGITSSEFCTYINEKSHGGGIVADRLNPSGTLGAQPWPSVWCANNGSGKYIIYYLLDVYK